MTPIEALDRAISYGILNGMRRPPGGVVSAMNPEVRAALVRLTSDELAKAGAPTYICRVGGRRSGRWA